MLRRLPLIFVLALLAAGCSGGGDKKSSAPTVNGESFVLSRADVGPSYTQFDTGKQVASDYTPPRDKPDRYGRQDGWKARFSRTGSHKPGPLVISSVADVFDSAKGAGEDFALYKDALDQFKTTGGHEVPVTGLGQEAHGVTYKQGLGPSAIRYYVIAWRDGAVTASVNMYGLKLTLQQAVALARKQEAHIQAAS